MKIILILTTGQGKVLNHAYHQAPVHAQVAALQNKKNNN